MKLKFIVLSILISTVVYTQPYYYYGKSNPNGDEKPGGYSIDIYRLNLTTNISEPFLIDVGRVNSPMYPNIEQSKIFFLLRFSLMVIDVKDVSPRAQEIMSGINEIVEIKDSPAMNRYYIVFDDNIEGNRKMVVLDRLTVQPIDTIYEKDAWFNSFLSQDEKSLYQLEDDSTGIYFSEYGIEQKQQRNSQRIGNFGPFLSAPYQRDSKAGYVLVSFASMDMSFHDEDPYIMNKHYVVCNINDKNMYIPIKFPWNSQGYLSPSSNYVVLEQRIVDWSQPDGKYHTGNISVFNAQSGQLMQHLQLPPQGKILLFNNYPDKLFYLTGTEGSFQSLEISLSVITPTATLIDTLISLINQSYVQNWLGDKNFVNELTNILNNAKKHLIKKDSVICYKKVKEFQKKVDEVYEEAIEKEKKHEKRENKFVTVEGWKFLYHNAQYIMDRLPHKNNDKGDDKEEN
ncbi:MAG: hypothetical protein WDA22_03715 [Bacteroidota bacterium]